MASRKLTALPTATEVTTSDKIYIVDVSDTTESPQGTSKQALISELPSSGITSLTSTDGSISIDNTDPSAPGLSIASPSIPLAGTAEGAPLTGIIYADNPASIRYVVDAETRAIGYNADGEFGISISDSASGTLSAIGVTSAGVGVNFFASDGLGAAGNIGLTLDSGEYNFTVNADKIGVFDKSSTPSPQAAAIADATNATDVITQFNTLLAAMRAYGLIAE